ncbi:MAG: hypothetical protein ABSB88_16995 [Bryobacteraceae bacterium]|jgi:hypothetical protein
MLHVETCFVPPPAARNRWESLTPAMIAGLAALLLFWGLADKYLWQDEAIMAVLATRMLQFGRPLAYDGVNLLTTDTFGAEDEQTIGERTTGPQAAVDYHARRGDFKPGFAWKWQPWGQFVVAAIGLKLLGHTTLGARLPFTLTGFAAVLLLFRFVRQRFDSLLMAALAALLLVTNAYWILHARQARYYSISSLFLVLALMAYARWQSGAPRGAVAFAATAWCWFQVDYGTVWPVLAVLFLDAFLAAPRRWLRTALVGVALSAAIAPFAWYYELWNRRAVQEGSWTDRALDNLFNMNEYVAPAALVLAALALLAWRWKRLPSLERRLVAVAIGIVLALVVWVPSVAPAAFLRYVIVAAPAAALVAAWLLARAAGSRVAIAWLGAAVLVLTPWMSLPLHAAVPSPDWYNGNPWWRSELSTLGTEVFGHRPDPNRLVIEWLKRNAAPSDEILINYEDAPLMFYLPNPIRGGIAAFRVEDDAKTAPRFLVLRKSVGFVHWPVFVREAGRYHWIPVGLKAPDVMWGNNPDPMAQGEDFSKAPDLVIARRVDGK